MNGLYICQDYITHRPGPDCTPVRRICHGLSEHEEAVQISNEQAYMSFTDVELVFASLGRDLLSTVKLDIIYADSERKTDVSS